MGYQFRFDEEKCTGCYACHIACLDAHFGPEEAVKSFRTVKSIVRQEEGFQKHVCPGCTHCGACIAVCPQDAVCQDAETGLVLIDKERCVGCKKCEQVCPIHVIQYDAKGKMAKCDGCSARVREGREPACVRACPVHAITFS